MRGIRICLIAAIALGAAGVTGAAGPMALTTEGDLYSAATRDNQVVLTARYADGTVEELFVPQSAAAVESSLQVGVDEATGAVYVLWQKWTGMEAMLRVAGYLDGTWIGPRIVAGNDGTAAYNPVMLIHRAVNEFTEGTDDDGEPVVTEVATTFLHLAWWSKFSEDDPGLAMYAAVELHSNGVPRFNEMEPVELYDLLPYGIACFEFEASENLRHPKLFIDPKSGNPHVFATDIANCLFQIVELIPQIEEEPVQLEKRRRQIIILRSAAMIALRPDLPLAKGKLVIGSSLRILMHWDADHEDAIRYLELDPDGISEAKVLMLDEDLNHEAATELIRELAVR
jgi:hypothetical protein